MVDKIEGFSKNNKGEFTETFRWKELPGLKISLGDELSGREVGFGKANIAKISFDERDRKAVADLFRKMADELDPAVLTKGQADDIKEKWSETLVKTAVLKDGELKAWQVKSPGAVEPIGTVGYDINELKERVNELEAYFDSPKFIELATAIKEEIQKQNKINGN